MNEEQKIILKNALLQNALLQLPRKFWEDQDHAVGGYISKKDLYDIMTTPICDFDVCIKLAQTSLTQDGKNYCNEHASKKVGNFIKAINSLGGFV